MDLKEDRSISKLPAISKMLEKFLYERLPSLSMKGNCFIRRNMVFIVNKLLPTLWLKLQNELDKGAPIH